MIGIQAKRRHIGYSKDGERHLGRSAELIIFTLLARVYYDLLSSSIDT
jgi:hypothetical protein